MISLQILSNGSIIRLKMCVCSALKTKQKDYQDSEKTADGRKNLQIIYLIRVWYPEYIKNSCSSTTQRQTTQFKNGQRTGIDISFTEEMQIANKQ